MEHYQARTIVLGAPHQLWCAALSLTFAAWAQRFCVVNAVAAEVRDLHMRRAFALVILSNSSARLRASPRNDRKQWRLEVQDQIQFDAAADISKGVFRGVARLGKKPMPATPWLELEGGFRIIGVFAQLGWHLFVVLNCCESPSGCSHD